MELTSADILKVLMDPNMIADPSLLPAAWPTGPAGVFMLFMFGLIPIGVIFARDAGVSWYVTLALYAFSDIFQPLVSEPMVMLFMWLGRKIPILGRIGSRIGRFTAGAAGLKDGGKRGPLGIALLSFTMSMTTSRFAAAAAGHGVVMSWTLAILGDIVYFMVLMASTLWLSSVLGDERLAVGAVFLGMFLAPRLIKKLRNRPEPVAARTVVTADAVVVNAVPKRSRAESRGRRGKRVRSASAIS